MSNKLFKTLTTGLMAGILSFSGSLSAFFFNNNDCCYDTSFCCEDGPLRCGAFNIQAKGGGVPTHYTERGPVWLTVPGADPAVFTVSRTAHFDKQYKTPWTVGAELSWNASSHIQLFAEYVYQKGSGKTYPFTAGTFDVLEVNSDYITNSFYLGYNYFCNSIWCSDCWGSVSPFIGIKGGIVWQKGSVYDLSLGGTAIGTLPYYHKQWAMSAGARIGLDWSINCNWGIVFTAELVGTQGLKNSRNNVTNPALTGGLTNVSVGETGKVISIPLTAGIRYTF